MGLVLALALALLLVHMGALWQPFELMFGLVGKISAVGMAGCEGPLRESVGILHSRGRAVKSCTSKLMSQHVFKAILGPQGRKGRTCWHLSDKDSYTAVVG